MKISKHSVPSNHIKKQIILRMKNKILILILLTILIVISNKSQAQLIDSRANFDTQDNIPNSKLMPSIKSSLHIGSLIYNKGFSTFIMPEITTPVAKKFHLSAGTMIMKTFDKSFSGNESGNKNTAGITSNLFYTKGTYLYNERISFSGMIFYEQHLFNNQFTKNNKNLNLNGKGFAMDMNYKINSTSQFSIGVSTTNGYGPFGNGLFYQPVFNNSPFIW